MLLYRHTWLCMLLIRKILIASFFMCSSLCVADEVILYNWDSNISSEVIEKFEQEKGHKVKQVTFNDEDLRDAVITSGRGVGFDLVLMDDATLTLMSDQGYFVDLTAEMPELGSLFDERWNKACTRYGLPYSWGTTGIVYRSNVHKNDVDKGNVENSSLVKPGKGASIQSWQHLFDVPEAYRGGVAMYMDSIDSVAAALLSIGANPFTEDADNLKQAYNVLQKQQSNLMASEYAVAYAQKHGANSKITLGLGYSGDATSLAEATGQSDWTYVVPESGTVIWSECWAAPKGKPISAATRAFIKFINRPEIAAINAEDSWFSTPHKKARELTSDKYKNSKEMNPTQETIAKGYIYKAISIDGLRQRERIIHWLENHPQ